MRILSHFGAKISAPAVGRASCLPLFAALLLAACDSGSSSVGTEASTQLSAPASVSVSFIDVNTLGISWSAVAGSSEYKLYMDDTSETASVDYVDAIDANETSYIKRNLEASNEYWFFIKACSSSSNADCSGYSEPAKGDTTPSDIAPSDFSADPGAGGIFLNWTAVDSYSYNLLRSKDNCISSLEDIDNSNLLCSELTLDINVSPGLLDSDIDEYSTYYYWLEAVDAFDNRSYASSNPASITEADFVPGEVIFSKHFPDGIDFAPALNEPLSRLYVASGNYLYSLDTILAKEKWDAPFAAEGVITAAPILDSLGNIYIAAATDSGNIIYKINSSGDLQWSSSGDNSTDLAGVRDSLAVAESDAADYLYFANASGSIYRSSDLSGNTMNKIHTMEVGVAGGLAVNWYGSMFLGDESSNLVIVSGGGVELTLAIGGSLVTAPAFDASQNVYFATESRLYSYTSSGIERWQSTVYLSSIASDPVLDSNGSSVYQADNDTLHKFDSNDGSEIWSYRFSNNVYGTAPVVDVDGNIYVGLSRDGQVVVLTEDGELLSTYTTGKSAGVSTPLKLGSEGKLYFSGGDWLFGIQAEAQVSQESPWSQYKGNARNTAFIGDSLDSDTDSFYGRVELDNEDLIFLEDENGRSWVSDDTDFTVGASSMRSPALDHSETACIRATTNNSGFLSFFWKVSSEKNFDYLKLSVISPGSGEETKASDLSLTGTVDWQQETGIAVSSGEEIRWCYEKDQTVSQGDDAGWLDGVQIQ